VQDDAGILGASAYSYYEHHCSYGDKNPKDMVGFTMVSRPECALNAITKNDCLDQLNKIANKWVSTGNKNDNISGDVYDQSCFGLVLAIPIQRLC
jgi:hypothetical protein